MYFYTDKLAKMLSFFFFASGDEHLPVEKCKVVSLHELKNEKTKLLSISEQLKV